MVNTNDVEAIFSKELEWIKDSNLKKKVIQVWKEAANRGGWKNLQDAPFTLLIENSGKLTDHTKRITNLAKSVYDNREENLNLDILIAGALLHDVGKLLEYVKKDGKYIKSKYGNKFNFYL